MLNSFWLWLLAQIYKPVMKRASYQLLQGRTYEPGLLGRGRWLKSDVDEFLSQTWTRVYKLLPSAQIETMPSYGNAHNLFLAVVTTAAYQVLLDRGVTQEYAITLMSDIGWKVYSRLLLIYATPIRWTTRDPSKRVKRTLKALMIFPFSSPGAPGYAVKAWPEGDAFFTHWTHCPPEAFVRKLVKTGPERGELEAFYHSWCLFDWSAADLLAGGKRGDHYERPHTLSKGDQVCDMCWKACSSSKVKMPVVK